MIMMSQEAEGPPSISREEILSETELNDLEINPVDLLQVTEEDLGVELVFEVDFPVTVGDFEDILTQKLLGEKKVS